MGSNPNDLSELLMTFQSIHFLCRLHDVKEIQSTVTEAKGLFQPNSNSEHGDDLERVDGSDHDVDA